GAEQAAVEIEPATTAAAGPAAATATQPAAAAGRSRVAAGAAGFAAADRQGPEAGAARCVARRGVGKPAGAGASGAAPGERGQVQQRVPESVRGVLPAAGRGGEQVSPIGPTILCLALAGLPVQEGQQPESSSKPSWAQKGKRPAGQASAQNNAVE